MNGDYTKELFIDRRENSKSLAWSSIKIAFNKALEKSGTVFTRPKELADVRGDATQPDSSTPCTAGHVSTDLRPHAQRW